jgi:hypothetical protein
MRTADQFRINRIMAYAMLVAGIVLLATSFFYTSVISAIIGLCLTFWGAILLYIAPTKHIPLEIMGSVAISTLKNVEKLLARLGLDGKGIYLPPKYLKDFESSLVFVPQTTRQQPPKPEEVNEDALYSGNPSSVSLTPPGLDLSRLFEKRLGTSFTRTDLKFVREKLPALLVEDLEIAECAEIRAQGSTVIAELENHIFTELCESTRRLPKTHEQLGCPLASAIACALAKATAKAVVIQQELNQAKNKTTITYLLMEE